MFLLGCETNTCFLTQSVVFIRVSYIILRPLLLCIGITAWCSLCAQSCVQRVQLNTIMFLLLVVSLDCCWWLLLLIARMIVIVVDVMLWLLALLMCSEILAVVIVQICVVYDSRWIVYLYTPLFICMLSYIKYNDVCWLMLNNIIYITITHYYICIVLFIIVMAHIKHMCDDSDYT